MSSINSSYFLPQSAFRSPDQSRGYRSVDRVQGRPILSSHHHEAPPTDPQNRYSISYVPGMSKHKYFLTLFYSYFLVLKQEKIFKKLN